MLRLFRINLYRAQEAVDTLLQWMVMQGTPPPAIAGVISIHGHAVKNSTEDTDKDDGILWAVPKSRRSREKRLTRKFGSETGRNKMLTRLLLLTCNHCGNVHQPGRLCPVCYSKTKEVTEAMQAAMNSTHGLNPVEHEVFPVFKGEIIDSKDGFFQGKRVVEVEKERPHWFSRRLKLKSTISTSPSTTIAKPTNLA
ncbi:hypothetical protein Pcinc_032567 [Petrolisthes cinctipes]|uniref:Large ribosomal subunit protein bL32m n=1 Tax=Petrolisthes cinctipes TaxID=88211 RepID=A0AAE1EU39_PETCI|nr:hypothetical protein Pcinc_032567 [Petrolisthes cinctipes]